METDEEEFEDDNEFLPPGPEVTADLFKQWRAPRVGRSNPERMDNPVWEWLIKAKADAFRANQHFDGPSQFEAGPGWCFDRFGQSTTKLPDGREVLIAGEHEDSYDPDFYIYNDVVVKQPDGSTEIYGYPKDVFPPTDFHSATLIGNEIIVVGNLGNPEERHPAECPVYALNIESFAIRSIKTTGMAPGWIHGHEGNLSGDRKSIVVKGGKLCRADESLVENIDDWQLHIEGWRWERLIERNWKRWEFSRKDKEPNHLWDIEQAHSEKLHPELDGISKIREELGEPPLEKVLGGSLDFETLTNLYRPPIEFEAIPDDIEEYGTKRIRINGVVVRYVQDSYDVQMTVEGELEPRITDVLTRDLRQKLSKLENSPFIQREL